MAVGKNFGHRASWPVFGAAFGAAVVRHAGERAAAGGSGGA